MKTFFRKGVAVMALLSATVFLVACSNEGENVRKYNDSIVGIEQQMVQKGESMMQDFGGDHIDVDKVVAQLTTVQADVKQSYDQFNALPVPKGGEDLAAAMKNFFDVETAGINSLITVVKDLKGKENDTQQVQKVIDTVNDFTKKEQDALDHFNQIQQSVAKKYGQVVEGN